MITKVKYGKDAINLSITYNDDTGAVDPDDAEAKFYKVESDGSLTLETSIGASGVVTLSKQDSEDGFYGAGVEIAALPEGEYAIHFKATKDSVVSTGIEYLSIDRTLNLADYMFQEGHYIFVDSALGSDTYDGLTPDRAKETIAAGAALIRDGKNDTLFIMNGDYLEDVVISSKSRFNIKGTDRKVYWKDSVADASNLELSDCHDVTIEGIYFDTHRFYSIYAHESSNLMIQNCLFKGTIGTEIPIRLYETVDVIIKENVGIGDLFRFIRAEHYSHRVFIHNNTLLSLKPPINGYIQGDFSDYLNVYKNTLISGDSTIKMPLIGIVDSNYCVFADNILSKAPGNSVDEIDIANGTGNRAIFNKLSLIAPGNDGSEDLKAIYDLIAANDVVAVWAYATRQLTSAWTDEATPRDMAAFADISSLEDGQTAIQAFLTALEDGQETIEGKVDEVLNELGGIVGPGAGTGTVNQNTLDIYDVALGSVAVSGVGEEDVDVTMYLSTDTNRQNPKYHVQTDAEGNFELHPDPGTYVITFSKAGFVAVEPRTVEVQ